MLGGKFNSKHWIFIIDSGTQVGHQITICDAGGGTVVRFSNLINEDAT